MTMSFSMFTESIDENQMLRLMRDTGAVVPFVVLESDIFARLFENADGFRPNLSKRFL
jgi:hypothetical protein